MKTAAGLITREVFSFTTLLFIVIPFLMTLSGPASYASPADWLRANANALTSALPVRHIEDEIRYRTRAGIYALRAQIPSLGGGSYIAGHGPIYLP